MRQYYHRGILIIVLIIGLISYAITGFSSFDKQKIFIETMLQLTEIVSLVIMMLLAVQLVSYSKEKKITALNYTHGISYPKTILSKRIVGVVLCLFLYIAVWAMYTSTTLLVPMLYESIGLMLWYTYWKVLLIYTIVYSIGLFSREILSVLSAGAIYIRLYAAYGLTDIIAKSEMSVSVWIIKGLIAISPPFVAVGYNSIDIDRLTANIFSIVIIYIIYIIILLTVSIGFYAKIRWK